MKRFSKRWFSQIMINKLLKKELDQFETIIMIETNINYKLRYGDVIIFLMNHYKKTKQNEYLIEPKLIFSTPLQKKTVNIASKLDGKQRASYTL